MDATSHESEERLELYALGRLPDSDLIGIEEHLLACEVCRGRLDETEAVAFAIRETLIDHPVPVQSRFEWFKPQFAFAGALAMALFAVVVFLWNGNSRLAPMASLQLTAMRGTDIQTVQPARELDITFGDAAGASKVDVVDSNGTPMWSGAPEIAGGTVRAKIAKALAPGDYFARVYDSPGHMLHEYGFRVKPKNE